MTVRELISFHIDHHINSFHDLSINQKREVAAYALDDEDFDIHTLLHIFIPNFKKAITSMIDNKNNEIHKNIIEYALDKVIKFNLSNFEEIFDEEFERHINQSSENLCITKILNKGEFNERFDAI